MKGVAFLLDYETMNGPVLKLSVESVLEVPLTNYRRINRSNLFIHMFSLQTS